MEDIQLTMKERLRKLIEILGMSISAFERKMDWPNGTFNNFSSNLSVGRIKQVVDVCNINRNWLITGRGEMYEVKPAEPSPVTEAAEPPVSLNRPSKDGIKTAPLIPIEISKKQNASLLHFVSQNRDRLPTYEPSQLFPEFDFIYRVVSNSMVPSIEKGDLLFLKHLNDINKDVVNGNCYVLDTEKYGLICRFLYNDGDCVVGHTASTEAEMSIPKSEITDIFAVNGMFKFDVPVTNNAKLEKELKTRASQINTVLSQNDKLVDACIDQGKRIDSLLNLLKERAHAN